MVLEGNADQVGGVLDLPGQLHVVVGRRGVAARVVVGQHERDGAQLDGGAKDIGGAHGAPQEAAAADHARAADAIVGVERGDPVLLVDERRERRVEEAGDVTGAPQALRAARARGVQAPAELEGGSEAGRRLERELGALRQPTGDKRARDGRSSAGRNDPQANLGDPDRPETGGGRPEGAGPRLASLPLVLDSEHGRTYRASR